MVNNEKLSILLPVFNEPENVKLMVQILESVVEYDHEVLIIYDRSEDTTVGSIEGLSHRYDNVRGVFNDIGPGVANAVKKGVSEAVGGYVLITLVDEIFPIVSIMDMLELIRTKECDFVSGTRYALGGKRFGGSLAGSILSRTANMLFRLITGSILTDATTGVKMFKKEDFDKFDLEASPVGWSFAFEMAIKAQLMDMRIGEVPVVSVDRLFGGESTFRLSSWATEYIKWFVWGVKRLNRVKISRKMAVTVDKK